MFFQLYLEFMTRIAPNKSETGFDVFDSMQQFWISTAAWTGIFSILFLLVPISLKFFANDWYQSLPKKKTLEFPAYLVCLVHHFYCVPRGWTHIVTDYNLSGPFLQQVNYPFIEADIAPFCLAYLFSDFLFYALREAKEGKYDYVIHHVMSVSMILATMAGPGYVTRFIPHLLICDTPNIFFNCAWILRLIPKFQDSYLVTLLEVTFSLTYFILRACHMPFMFYSLLFNPNQPQHVEAEEEISPILKFSIIPIVLLQWFWSYKILMGMMKRLLPSPSKKQKNT